MKYKKIKTILKYASAIIFYAGAFWILRDTFIRELLAIFLIIIGVNIQNKLFE